MQRPEDVEAAAIPKLELALAVACYESMRRWEQLGNSGTETWASDFDDFLVKFYGRLDARPNVDTQRITERVHRDELYIWLQEEISEALSHSLDPDDYGSAEFDSLVFNRPEELMRLAIETALLSVNQHPGGSGTAGGIGRDATSADVSLAYGLGLSQVSTAGLEEAAETLNFDYSVFRECADSSSLDARRADELEALLLDFRVALLSRFRGFVFENSADTEASAASLSLVPVIDYVVGRVRGKAFDKQPRARNAVRPWTQPDVELARSMMRDGRTRSEISRRICRPESQLAELLGSGNWPEWEEHELDILEMSLQSGWPFIEPLESFCDLMMFRDYEMFRQWEYRWEHRQRRSRSPWDIALRARWILYDMPPFWAGVALAIGTDTDPEAPRIGSASTERTDVSLRPDDVPF